MSVAREGLKFPAAVLFDMDGTLIDSEHLWLMAEQSVMSGLGGEWTDADQAHCLGGPLERVATYMVSSVGSSRSAESVGMDLMDEVEHLMRREPVIWRPGARELLAETVALAVPTALVTASWRRLVQTLHERISTDIGVDPFTVIVPGDEVARSKPHPDPYLRAATLLSASPRASLAVEDSPTGVSSAVAAECNVLAVPHLAQAVFDPAVQVVSSLQGRSLESIWGWFTPSR